VKRHSFRRVAEHEGDQAGLSQSFRVSAHLTKMVRVMNGTQCNTLIFGDRLQSFECKIDSGVSEAETRIDPHDTRCGASKRRDRLTVDLSGAGLQRVCGNTTQAVRGLSISLGCDECACRRARTQLGSAVGTQCLESQ
jgi:hypothetical protein